MASVVRGSQKKRAPPVSDASLVRIAPSSPFSCRGPYDVSDKASNQRMAQIRLSSNMTSGLTMTWQVAIDAAQPDGRPLTRSSHEENEASKEWEVSVRDGNGTEMYRYAYRRFNPALGSQRMNVTDARGAIVAYIEYMTRSELRVYTCMDSESPLVGGKEGSNGAVPSASPSPGASPQPQGPAPSPGAAGSLLQAAAGRGRQEPEAEPSPDAKPRGPQFRGPCEHPRETARLSQAWGDSAAHAWTLQRFEAVEGTPPAAGGGPPAAAPRFASVTSRAAAAAERQRFLGEQYDALMLLELAALVSHDEAPWCLAVTSVYVLLIALTILLAGIGVASCLSRRGRTRRRKGAPRRRREKAV